MKRFLFLTSVVALGLIMGSCNDLKKMAANADDINYSVNPKVLEVHNGQVAVNITGNFPEKYFRKKVSATLTPTLVWDGGEKALTPIYVEGEKVKGNGQVIKYKPGGAFSYNDKFDYSPEMRRSKLVLKITAVKGTKEAEFDPEDIAEGIVATPELVKMNGGKSSNAASNFKKDNAASKIAGRNTKCAGWVSQNETNRLILAKLRETKSKLEKDRDDLLGEKRDITSEMSKNQKLIGYLKSKDTLESTLKDQIKSLAEIEEQLQPEVDGSWKSLLADVAKSQAELLEKEYQDLSQAESNTSYSKMVLQLLKENESKCQCPTCRNTLSVSSYQELIRLYERSIGEKDRNFDRIIPLRNNISKLHQISATNNKKLVSELLHVVNNKKRDILFTKGKIKDEELRISSEGKDANTVETELLALPGRLSDIEKKITLNQGAIENNENDIRQKKKAIEDLDRKIASEGAGEEFEVAQARAELVESLQSLFEESITIFRNELTRNVEQDASEFFASITNQPEQYDHLDINDNFGLEIIHKEGMAVPNRSGGEEQIVAFSLINALHKNAPIDGPIFMDSTFQRIDKGHQTKSAGSLLTFNTQIIIFVYEDEIKNIDEAYRLIGDRLIREYKISKVGGDTFKSKIE